MTPQVAVYVPDPGKLAKQSGEFKDAATLEGRKNLGLAIIKDTLERAGIPVGYAGAATVHRYRVILHTITAQVDWWPWIAERASWPRHARPFTILGGAGVLNVRPFLETADAFVLGRGEHVIVDLVRGALDGAPPPLPGVIYPDRFAPTDRYTINQTAAPYPHTVALHGAKHQREDAIGCTKRCLFCAVTWHRQRSGQDAYAMDETASTEQGWEATILRAIDATDDQWRRIRVVGLDGTSARLRRLTNKRIDRPLWQRFLRLAAAHERAYLRIYNIVGIPTEGPADFAELLADLRAVDASLPAGPTLFLTFTNTPIKPTPATPSANWPYPQVPGTRYVDHQNARLSKHRFLVGHRIHATHHLFMESPATVALDALTTRGTEEHAAIFRRLALTKRFWGLDAGTRLRTIRKHVDLDALLGPCKWEDLPTAYLETRFPSATLSKLSAHYLRKYGGVDDVCDLRMDPEWGVWR